MNKNKMIGFTCAYTPKAIIHAAGYTPYRILPIGNALDQAGHILHENLCSHIKRVLDRALQNDIPELAGLVFINSCDSMRRLADAWKKVRPDHKIVMLDLPAFKNELSISYFSEELLRLVNTLSEWSGDTVSLKSINNSVKLYNELESLLDQLHVRMQSGMLKGGSEKFQTLCNLASTQPLQQTIKLLKTLVTEPEFETPANDGVPVFLFGNVLPDPDAYSLFEKCGARIVDDDFCTGSRLFKPLQTGGPEEILKYMAKSLFLNTPCARTFDPLEPGKIARDIINRAKACNAKGVIAYTLKFCDPYLDRLPMVRSILQDASIPFLMLEGDCTQGSIGQQQTRIEAFIEMLR